MTNGQKFVTAKERAEAFFQYCEKRDCEECKLNEMRSETARGNDHVCLAFWLDLEAEEEKPETIDDVIEDMAKAAEMMRKKESEGDTLFNVSVIFDTFLNRITAAHSRTSEKRREVKE